MNDYLAINGLMAVASVSAKMGIGSWSSNEKYDTCTTRFATRFCMDGRNMFNCQTGLRLSIWPLPHKNSLPEIVY